MKSEIHADSVTAPLPPLPALMEWIDPIKDVNRVLIVLFSGCRTGTVVHANGCSGRSLGEIATFADYSDRNLWKPFKGKITLQND